MNLSYDYTNLIKELKSDLNENLISINDYIYILRDINPIGINNYYPIIDYYYNLYSELELEELKEINEDAYKNYIDNKDKLIKLKVAEILEELTDWDNITHKDIKFS